MLKITKLHKTPRMTRIDNSGFEGFERIEATVGLRYLDGNADAYFTATCAIFEGARDVGGGADHAAILATFPDLAPFVTLHLSDTDGVPMYAKENGWYWYNAGDRGTTAKLLRIPRGLLPRGLTISQFGQFVDSLRPYWKYQSDQALALLDSLTR
jgi:hypothetical protein